MAVNGNSRGYTESTFEDHSAEKRASQRRISHVSQCVCYVVPFQANSPSKDGEQKSVTSRVKCFPTQRPWLAHLHYKVCACMRCVICHLNPAALCTPSWHSCGRSINYIGLRKCASSPRAVRKKGRNAGGNGFHARAQLGSLQHFWKPVLPLISTRYIFSEWEKRNKCNALCRERFEKISED